MYHSRRTSSSVSDINNKPRLSSSTKAATSSSFSAAPTTGKRKRSRKKLTSTLSSFMQPTISSSRAATAQEHHISRDAQFLELSILSSSASSSLSQHQQANVLFDSSSKKADLLLNSILQEIAEIKRKYPIVNVPDELVKEINNNSNASLSSISRTDDEFPLSSANNYQNQKKRDKDVEDQRNEKETAQNPSSSTSTTMSQQLALEREKHRVKLDQIWRCAQGWKSRYCQIENRFKEFAEHMLFQNEVSRLARHEQRCRLEILKNEESEWSQRILQFLNSVLLINCSKAVHSSTSSSSSAAVYRVKDSELLRSLKVAEERLAELGEPSAQMLTLKKNLVVY